MLRLERCIPDFPRWDELQATLFTEQEREVLDDELGREIIALRLLQLAQEKNLVSLSFDEDGVNYVSLISAPALVGRGCSWTAAADDLADLIGNGTPPPV